MKHRRRLWLDARGGLGLLLPVAALLAAACAPGGRAAAPYDLLFIDAMVVHHQAAVDMAGPAESAALRPEVKEFARRVVEDQSREIATMNRWRQEWFPGRPKAAGIMDLPGMSESMGDMSADHLQMFRGAEFDRMFVEMMIPHHEGAVTMAKDALARSRRPEVRELARAIIDAQQAEIEMMRRWQSEWSAGRAD